MSNLGVHFSQSSKYTTKTLQSASSKILDNFNLLMHNICILIISGSSKCTTHISYRIRTIIRKAIL
ncbi:hypothetical protein HCR08_00820 [Wolbachia pipientis]|nr:hypothetical protein [Wolbachia pipientis]